MIDRTVLAALCGIAALGLGAAEARAQAMPFHTPTAMPLSLAENAVRSFYQHVEMGSLFRDGEEIDDPSGMRVGVDMVPLVVPYGLTPKTILFVGIPYVWKTFEAGPTGEQSNRGLGDAFLLVKQELLQKDFPAGNRRLALFGGASFPTGETDDGGEPLPMGLRLGQGTADLTGFAVYSHVDDRIGLHGRLGYVGAVGDEFGVRAGDRVLYDLALGYRLFPNVYQSMQDVTLAAYLELNGTAAQPATRDGAELDDTGGHTLFVSPGVQLIPFPNWALEASFQLPVLHELRGTQLGPDWSFAIGARTVFYLFGH